MAEQTARRGLGVLAAGAILAAISVVPVPVSAHHGWGGYAESTSEITGTVESPVSMAGPHASMKVKVDGKVWNVVLAPPPRSQSAGLKDGMIPVEGVKKLAEKHRKQQIFIYAADHGFNCDQRGSYNAPAAKQARERTLEFFRKQLG